MHKGETKEAYGDVKRRVGELRDMAHEKYAGWGPEVAPPQPAVNSSSSRTTSSGIATTSSRTTSSGNATPVPGQPAMVAQVPGQPAVVTPVPGQPAVPHHNKKLNHLLKEMKNGLKKLNNIISLMVKFYQIEFEIY